MIKFNTYSQEINTQTKMNTFSRREEWEQRRGKPAAADQNQLRKNGYRVTTQSARGLGKLLSHADPSVWRVKRKDGRQLREEMALGTGCCSVEGG